MLRVEWGSETNPMAVVVVSDDNTLTNLEGCEVNLNTQSPIHGGVRPDDGTSTASDSRTRNRKPPADRVTLPDRSRSNTRYEHLAMRSMSENVDSDRAESLHETRSGQINMHSSLKMYWPCWHLGSTI